MKKGKLWIENIEFDILITENIFDKMRGYMFREVNDKEGILFIFKNEKPKFWMLNVKEALDIAFIDKNKIIFEISSLELNSEITPSKPIYYAFETKKGNLKKCWLGKKIRWIQMK